MKYSKEQRLEVLTEMSNEAYSAFASAMNEQKFDEARKELDAIEYIGKLINYVRK